MSKISFFLFFFFNIWKRFFFSIENQIKILNKSTRECYKYIFHLMSSWFCFVLFCFIRGRKKKKKFHQPKHSQPNSQPAKIKTINFHHHHRRRWHHLFDDHHHDHRITKTIWCEQKTDFDAEHPNDQFKP